MRQANKLGAEYLSFSHTRTQPIEIKKRWHIMTHLMIPAHKHTCIRNIRLSIISLYLRIGPKKMEFMDSKRRCAVFHHMVELNGMNERINYRYALSFQQNQTKGNMLS